MKSRISNDRKGWEDRVGVYCPLKLADLVAVMKAGQLFAGRGGNEEML